MPNPIETPRRDRGLAGDLWRHPWGRVLLAAATIGAVSWAARETAFLTRPVLDAGAAVALPLAIGFTLAYILAPLVELVRRTGLPRWFAALLLYTVFAALAALAVALTLPAVLRQSGDLAARLVQDRWFLDADADGRRSGGEPLLTALGDGAFLADADGDHVADPGEQVVPRSHPRLVRDASLLQRAAAWAEAEQARFSRLVGAPADPAGRRLLALHLHETASVRAVLDEGLAVARDSRPYDQWPEALREEPAALPPLDAAWDFPRSWPGCDPAAFEAAARALPADLTREQRDRWREAMRWHGRLFAHLHREVLAAWDAHLAGTEPSPAVLPPLPSGEGPAARLLTATLGRNRAAILADLRAGAASPIPESACSRCQAGLPAAAAQGAAWAEDLTTRLRSAAGEATALDNLADRLAGETRAGLARLSTDLAGRAGALVANLPVLLGLGLDLVLIPIYAFFLTLAMPTIRQTVRRYLPAHGRDRLVRLLHEVERVVAAFFRGRLIVCLICGVLIFVPFALLRVPYAGLFAVLIGLATAVPLAGLLFLVPACLLMTFDGGEGLVLRLSLAVGAYTAVQVLETAVLTPTIMGREVELHPVTLILALLLCGHLWGVLGLILAVPIAATVRIVLREYALPRLRAWADLPAESRLWRRAPGSHDPPP